LGRSVPTPYKIWRRNPKKAQIEEGRTEDNKEKWILEEELSRRVVERDSCYKIKKKLLHLLRNLGLGGGHKKKTRNKAFKREGGGGRGKKRIRFGFRATRVKKRNARRGLLRKRWIHKNEEDGEGVWPV